MDNPARDKNREKQAQVIIDLTGFAPNQAKFLRQMAENMQPPKAQTTRKEKEHDDEAHNAYNGSKRQKQAKSVFSRLGSSQETRHPRHGKDHHPPEIWKENRRKRDLRHYLELKWLQLRRTKGNWRRNTMRKEKRRRPRSSHRWEVWEVHNKNYCKQYWISNEKWKEESPFTKRLEDERKQRHLKHPNLNSYDGTGDPEEHLTCFDQLGKFYDYRDLTSCRFFAITLRGNA